MSTETTEHKTVTAQRRTRLGAYRFTPAESIWPSSRSNRFLAQA